MESISDYSKLQYALVKDSRKVLFEYCRTIEATDFLNQNSSFGRGGSMRNLLVHIATTYQYWVANTTLLKNIPYAEYQDYSTIEEVVALFDTVDTFMDAFIGNLSLDKEIEYEIQGERKSANAFQLFSHVITHEFHHKGQILSLSRHLGYIPVDTDILR